MASKIIPREDLERIIDVQTRPKGEKEAVAKVLDFLEELALEKEEGDVQVELLQQSRGSQLGQPLCSLEIRAGEDLQEVATQIVDEAVKDGLEGASGKTRYRVVAKGRRGSKTFTLTFPESDGDLDEYPNEKGALAQSMAMNADLHRTVIELVRDTTRTHKAIIGEMGIQLRKHSEVVGHNFQMMQDLTLAIHERQLSLVKAERGERRMDEVAGFLMTAGQLVFNSFLGKRVFQNAPTPIEHMTYATLSTFDQEQAQAMMQGKPFALRQEQALGLFKLFEALDQHYKQQKGPEGAMPQAYVPTGASANGYAPTSETPEASSPPADNPAAVAM